MPGLEEVVLKWRLLGGEFKYLPRGPANFVGMKQSLQKLRVRCENVIMGQRIGESLGVSMCYEMDKTSISCSKFLSPGGQLWANTAFEGSQFYSIGVPKFYSWVNVISVYAYNDLG